MKIGLMGSKEITASPEYEDCKKAAEAHEVPIRQVYDEAIGDFVQKCKQSVDKSLESG